MSYSRHGDIIVTIDENLPIVYLELTGPFNHEFMSHYISQMMPVREQMHGKIWGSVARYKGESLLPLSTLNGVIETLKGAQKMGLAVTAIVFDQEYPSTIEMQFWDQIYSKVNLPHEYVPSKSDAKGWIMQQLRID